MSSAEKLTRMFLAAPSPPMVVFLDNAPLPCTSHPNGGRQEVCATCLFVLNHVWEEIEPHWPGKTAPCLTMPDSNVTNDFSGSLTSVEDFNRTVISEYRRLAVHYGVAHVSMLPSLE